MKYVDVVVLAIHGEQAEEFIPMIRSDDNKVDAEVRDDSWRNFEWYYRRTLQILVHSDCTCEVFSDSVLTSKHARVNIERIRSAEIMGDDVMFAAMDVACATAYPEEYRRQQQEVAESEALAKRLGG